MGSQGQIICSILRALRLLTFFNLNIDIHKRYDTDANTVYLAGYGELVLVSGVDGIYTDTGNEKASTVRFDKKPIIDAYMIMLLPTCQLKKTPKLEGRCASQLF